MSGGQTMEFERPILELERQIEELHKAGHAAEAAPLEAKRDELRRIVYGNLSPIQRVQVARNPRRPFSLDYIALAFTDFVELHGDRAFRDDAAIVGGWARLDGETVMVIGHQRGRDTKENLRRNFGMPHPEGYRKALRLMKLAEKFQVPVLTLIDTREGLILAYLGFTLPFCTWLLLGYFRSVPLELEEAALVDGCSHLGALVRIILPMSLPALAVVAFFSFTQAWNEFIYANVLVNSVDVRTITTGLTLFIVEDVFFWGPMMAASVMATIPPVLVYLAFQRWVVKGLTLGAVKG